MVVQSYPLLYMMLHAQYFLPHAIPVLSQEIGEKCNDTSFVNITDNCMKYCSFFKILTLAMIDINFISIKL